MREEASSFTKEILGAWERPHEASARRAGHNVRGPADPIGRERERLCGAGYRVVALPSDDTDAHDDPCDDGKEFEASIDLKNGRRCSI